jgi:HEAT repeat protein
MRLTIPKLRTWHLLGIVAASAIFFSVMQFRWSVEDPGYALIRRLRSLDAAERAKAAGGLGSLRPMDRRAIAPLTEMLFDSDSSVRAWAARALNYVVPQDDAEAGTVKAALTSTLVDRDPAARRAIAVSLAHFQPEPGVVVPALLEFIRDANPEARGEVIEKSVLTFRSTTLPQAIAELDNADPIIRALAAGRIEDLGSRASDAVPILVRCLADRDADVRRAAAGALGQLGPRASVAIPTLASLAESDLDERVRQAATLSRSILLQQDAGSSASP